MFGLIMIGFALLGLSPGNLHDLLQRLTLVAVELVSFSMVGLFASLLWKSRPRATAISVDSEGVEISWSSGRRDSVGWSDFACGFVLLDYTINPALPKLTPYLWELRKWNRPHTRLSRNAFDAIIDLNSAS